MLPQENYNYIILVLTQQHDQYMASKCYLDHQISLPDNHRMMMETEEQAKATIEIMGINIKSCADAIAELQKSQGTPKPSFS